MKALLTAAAVFAMTGTAAVAQRSAATPSTDKPLLFEVARVNPGAGAKTRTVRVEALGRANTVQVGEAVLTRAHLRSASTGSERIKVTSGAKPETREIPVIRLRFTKEGAKALGALSREAVGGLLAVLIDGKLIAMPKVTQPLRGSEWTISGNFTADAAKEIVERINAAR